MSTIDPKRLEFTQPIHCYDGAFDSASQRVIHEQARVLSFIQAKEPAARVTYFPVEEQHVVHSWGRELSGYHSTRGAALYDAYQKLTH